MDGTKELRLKTTILSSKWRFEGCGFASDHAAFAPHYPEIVIQVRAPCAPGAQTI